jgi:hypothetical protein
VNFIISHINRKTVMFCLGAGGFLHELVFSQVERPVIIAACCALMGLPFVLNAEKILSDGRTRKEDKGEES